MAKKRVTVKDGVTSGRHRDGNGKFINIAARFSDAECDQLEGEASRLSLGRGALFTRILSEGLARKSELTVDSLALDGRRVAKNAEDPRALWQSHDEDTYRDMLALESVLDLDRSTICRAFVRRYFRRRAQETLSIAFEVSP